MRHSNCISSSLAGMLAMYASSPSDASASLFAGLGVLQFLLEPAHRSDLDSYVTQVLGPLIAYDREHGSHLVDTVAAYLRCNCHLQHAAAALFVHHKTMSYRLARVSTLTRVAAGRPGGQIPAPPGAEDPRPAGQGLVAGDRRPAGARCGVAGVVAARPRAA